MAKKPPRADRRVNGDISVDLSDFLKKLSRALSWKGDESSLGGPGPYYSFTKWGDSSAPGEVAVGYLFEEIMSKFDDELKSSDLLKTDMALAKFRQAENMCSEANEFFHRASLASEACAPRDCDPDVWEALCLARRRLVNLLGEFDWNEAACGFRFTSGSSYGLPRARSTPAHKYSGKLEITSGAEALANAALQHNPAWGRHLSSEPVRFVTGNRLLCVPKSYKVHRVIAAEPSGNMYFQKGIGYALRRRLQAVGIDLKNQKQNQDWAYLGSCTDLVSTVDLSMASDTVSKGIVEFAIPPSWVAAMSLCRSECGELPSGEKVLYRKWSSMGNASTFELETTLFYGLAWAATKLSKCDTRFIAVYGDDIIVPRGACQLLMRILARCGFKPNTDKTFVSGPFRESCGKHYFQGKDVSPFYIRRQPKRLTDLFLLVNNLRRWFNRVEDLLSQEQKDAVRLLLSEMRSLAPSQWRRPRIPDNYGDGAFIGSFDECLPRRPRGNWLWWEGWQVEVISDVRKRIKRMDESEFLNVNGVMLAMLESSELGQPPVNDDSDHWYENIPESLGGGVLPNRRKRWITTTMIVAQY